MDIKVLDHYKARIGYRKGITIPEATRKQMDLVWDNAWYNDPQVRPMKLYKHKEGSFGKEYITIAEDDGKFIHRTIQEIGGQTHDFYLQFKPDRNYPIGLYVDIEDEHGVVHTWLIAHKALDMQFVLYNIVECNYMFRWVNNNHIYESLGALRNQNSYSSGTATKASTVMIIDDRDSMWIPTDDVSANFYYDKRIIIAIENRHIPFVYKATKINELVPRGISKITVTQDKYNPETDYSEIYGYIADINTDVIVNEGSKGNEGAEKTSSISPYLRSKKPNTSGDYDYSPITNYKISFGNTIKFTAELKDENGNVVTPNLVWDVKGLELTELENYSTDNNELSFKIKRDYTLGGKRLVVSVADINGDYASSIELEVLVV